MDEMKNKEIKKVCLKCNFQYDVSYTVCPKCRNRFYSTVIVEKSDDIFDMLKETMGIDMKKGQEPGG